MTTDELIAYYADLLIIQYRNQPRAYATMQALCRLTIMDQLPFALRDAFGVSDAIGVQLDTLGKYIGVSRLVLTFSGQVVLDDDDYRTLLKLKLVQNNSGSSLKDIQELLYDFLPGALSVFDRENMTMDYFFNSAYGSETLAEAVVRQDLLPKPMGVQLGALIYVADLTNIYGYRTYDLATPNSSGFNTYDDYDTDTHWLSYDDAVIS